MNINNTESEDFRQKTLALMRKHKLGFLFNPGGGEFTHSHPKLPTPCQVPAMDNKEDYERLMKHLINAGLEPSQ